MWPDHSVFQLFPHDIIAFISHGQSGMYAFRTELRPIVLLCSRVIVERLLPCGNAIDTICLVNVKIPDFGQVKLVADLDYSSCIMNVIHASGSDHIQTIVQVR